jgi:hypothetical protein
LTDLHAAILNRQAAVGRPLVRRQRGVALNDIDVCHRDVEFVGNDLRQAGADAKELPVRTTETSEQVNQDRRRLLGAAAIAQFARLFE